MFLRHYTRKKRGKDPPLLGPGGEHADRGGAASTGRGSSGELNSREQRRWQRTLVFYNRHGDIEQLRLFPDDPAFACPTIPTLCGSGSLRRGGPTPGRSATSGWGLWLWRLLKLDEILDRHLPAGRHLAKQAGLTTFVRKPDLEYGETSPKPRPMSPETILRELAKIQIGDIVLETGDGRRLALRRVARPTPEQARILAALKLSLPERLSPDRLL